MSIYLSGFNATKPAVLPNSSINTTLESLFRSFVFNYFLFTIYMPMSTSNINKRRYKFDVHLENLSEAAVDLMGHSYPKAY